VYRHLLLNFKTRALMKREQKN